MIYWHIQMHQPYGRDKTKPKIDSSKMIEEKIPVIGTGEWNDIQYRYFINKDPNAMNIGDIILVREGRKPIALCKITSSHFEDENLTKKYFHNVFRQIKVLEYHYHGRGLFPQPQGTLQRLVNNKTASWNFINDWYQSYLKNQSSEKMIDILRYKKQIILQGPPGTGKTYAAKNLAEQMILGSISGDKTKQKRRLEESGQFQLIQFHPSYSYEDFVRGITVKSENGQIEYLTENKVLAAFAKKANDNFLNSQKDRMELSKQQWISQELQKFAESVQDIIDKEEKYVLTNKVDIVRVQEDAFRYSGTAWKNELRMKFEDIILLYMDNVQNRQDIKKNGEVSTLAKEHATYYFSLLKRFRESIKGKIPKTFSQVKEPLNHYILLIDEINRANLPSVLGELIYALEYRDEAVESMYALDGNRKLILPKNLYIIGTMNTADRSVGHIDYAIRRRFAFVDMLPNAEVIELDKAKALFEKVSELFVKDGQASEYLAPDFNYQEVQLGHSYFMATDEEELNLKLKYEIIPILREYLKDGILLDIAGEKIEQLKNF